MGECRKGPPVSWVAGCLTQNTGDSTRSWRPRARLALALRLRRSEEEEEEATAGKGREAWARYALRLENVRAASLRFCKAPGTHVGLRGGSLTCPIWNYILAIRALQVAERSPTGLGLGGPQGQLRRGPAPSGRGPCKTCRDWPFEPGRGLAPACSCGHMAPASLVDLSLLTGSSTLSGTFKAWSGSVLSGL